MAKSYQLVAWTERGEVRMVPSLLEALSLPYRERIAAIEAQWEHVEDETGWLYAQSKAHEAFGKGEDWKRIRGSGWISRG